MVNVDADDIVLTWTAPAGTQGNYIIYRYVVPYFEISAAQSVFTYTGPTTGEVTWVDPGALSVGINYFYIVTHEILPETAGNQGEPQGIPKENTRQ